MSACGVGLFCQCLGVRVVGEPFVDADACLALAPRPAIGRREVAAAATTTPERPERGALITPSDLRPTLDQDHAEASVGLEALRSMTR